MLQSLEISQLLPNVFGGQLPENIASGIWLQDVVFGRGQSYLIEAASGRGKTSLCSFLYGLRFDYQGTITWRGDGGVPLDMRRESVAVALRQRGIAMMFQDMRVFPELTAVENVLLKNNLCQYTTEAEIRQKLSLLGLSDRLDVPCQRLSIGQQQRVAFVRLMSQPADFALLDEPVSHLDDQNGIIMSQMLADWQQKEGCGVIVTSIGRRLPYSYDQVITL